MITRTQTSYQDLDWESIVFPTASDAKMWTNVTIDIDTFGRIHLHRKRRSVATDADGLLVTMQHVGSGILVTLTGKLDGTTGPAMQEVLSWPEGTRSPKLYLHMEHVWSIDVTGRSIVEEMTREGDAHIIHHSEAHERLDELIGA